MNDTNKGWVSRRRLLNWATALGALMTLPARVWATVARPETAFDATALDQAFMALGETPTRHEGVIFTTPDIAENGAVVPIRVEVDPNRFAQRQQSLCVSGNESQSTGRGL
jgi:sulfur-oxidizing protein SoxY